MKRLKKIGIIHTPFTSRIGMPIQVTGAKGVKGRIILKKKYVPGLADLEGFSHIILIYHFHKSNTYKLLVTPFLDTAKRGIFSTRAPVRPNPIGISVVRLLKVDGRNLEIENVDMMDGTPLLDIKPYVPAFDIHEVESAGWTEGKAIHMDSAQSDSRF